MKLITQRESVVTYIKSCLIFQIPRFTLISKYRVISPLRNKCGRILTYPYPYHNQNISILSVVNV